MQNTSLNEFLKDESDGRSGPGEESGDGGGSTDRDRPREEPRDSTDSGAGTPRGAGNTPSRNGGDSEDRIDPSTPASRWQPDGQDCARCEHSVTRLWSDDGRLVCADCKDWA